jgi:predicted transcriptional regulator
MDGEESGGLPMTSKEIILAACRELGITQKELAQQIGITVPYLWQAGEKEKMPLKTYNRIMLLIENARLKKRIETGQTEVGSEESYRLDINEEDNQNADEPPERKRGWRKETMENIIKAACCELGITQGELGDRIGMGQKYMYNMATKNKITARIYVPITLALENERLKRTIETAQINDKAALALENERLKKEVEAAQKFKEELRKFLDGGAI